MKIKVLAITCLFLFSSPTFAEPVIDEALVKSISAEFTQATKDADSSVFEKYLYSGSKITVDMDPAEGVGEVDVPYNDYMQLLAMALPLMQQAEIEEEILSIEVDKAANQATIKEKVSSKLSMMGVRMHDVSVTETIYGIVDGQVKVLVAKEKLISSQQIPE